MGFLDSLKAKITGLKTPSLYYAPQEPDIPYAPVNLGTPDFGLSAPQGPESLAAPSALDNHQNGTAPVSAVGSLAQQIVAKRAEAAKQAATQQAAAFGILSDAMRNRDNINQPLPEKPKPLTDSEALIPAGIGFIAQALGARPQYVQPAVQNFYQGAVTRHQQEAHQKDLENQQKYQHDMGVAGTNVDLAKMGYIDANSTADSLLKSANDAEDLVIKGEMKPETMYQVRANAAAKLAELYPDKYTPDVQQIYIASGKDWEAQQQEKLLNDKTKQQTTNLGQTHDLNAAKGKRDADLQQYVVQRFQDNHLTATDRHKAAVQKYDSYPKELAFKLGMLDVTIQDIKDRSLDREFMRKYKTWDDFYKQNVEPVQGAINELDKGAAEIDTDLGKASSEYEAAVQSGNETDKAYWKAEMARLYKAQADLPNKKLELENKIKELQGKPNPFAGAKGKVGGATKPSTIKGGVGKTSTGAPKQLSGIKGLTVSDLL